MGERLRLWWRHFMYHPRGVRMRACALCPHQPYEPRGRDIDGLAGNDVVPPGNREADE